MMAMYRVFPDENGESHIEPLSLDDHAYLEAFNNVTEAGIRHYTELRWMDFHPLPERRLIIQLVGEIEIGLSDGTKQRFGPGDVRLMEDVTGKGHTHEDVTECTQFIMLLKD